MKVGIHTDLHDGLEEEKKAVGRFVRILEHNGIDQVRLDAGAGDFWDRVEGLDLFIFPRIGTPRHRQISTAIMPVIENHLGVRCFPDMKTSWHYDDKIREYYLLRRRDFPAIPTYIFWDRAEALSWLETSDYPLVFKLKGGASSVNVVLVRNHARAERLVKLMFTGGIVSGLIPGNGNVRWKDYGIMKTLKRNVRTLLRRMQGDETEPFREVHKNYVLFQKYLPNNTFDTRVTIIGDRAFVSRRFVRPGDFRASGGNISDWSQDTIDLRFLEIAFQVSRALDFQCMAYDFLYDEHKNPLISEISYMFPDWTVWTCPGYWDSGMNWHEGHRWPQYCILSDVLGLPDLKQPEDLT